MQKRQLSLHKILFFPCQCAGLSFQRSQPWTFAAIPGGFHKCRINTCCSPHPGLATPCKCTANTWCWPHPRSRHSLQVHSQHMVLTSPMVSPLPASAEPTHGADLTHGLATPYSCLFFPTCVFRDITVYPSITVILPDKQGIISSMERPPGTQTWLLLDDFQYANF
ncbi:hypothetical protein BsWGS_01131 [Bradybaena similaris]